MAGIWTVHHISKENLFCSTNYTERHDEIWNGQILLLGHLIMEFVCVTAKLLITSQTTMKGGDYNLILVHHSTFSVTKYQTVMW